MNERTSTKGEEHEGRVALVTGAAGIVGPGICSVLRREGWRVAASDRSEEHFRRYEKCVGEPVACEARFPADLSAGRETCVRLVKKVREELGEIALLVNGAVENVNSEPFESVSEEVVERMTRLDLLAPLYLAQAAYPSLAKTHGSVVNISSVMTRRMFAGNFLYATLKAGLEKMTEALALETAERGVRINAIRLGAVPGWGYVRALAADLTADQAQRLYRDARERWRRERSGDPEAVPLHGVPEDVGEAVAFLASAKARYFHGAVVPLDGGWWFRIEPQLPQRVAARRESWREWVSDWFRREGLSPPAFPKGARAPAGQDSRDLRRGG